MKNILYIGLRGLAGSGKDTCANFLSFILDNYDLDKKDGWERYTAIVNSRKVVRETLRNTFVIAFADQLKQICATIFGISIDAFYNGNKANAWVCLNKDFAYTEIKPTNKCIMTAEEFYLNKDNTEEEVWMSLRELMVYVGCYVLQYSLTRNIFVNVVNNEIQRYQRVNPSVKYVICSDVRFQHEVDYINRKFGIMINITSNRVSCALDNIAEQSLNDNDLYDYHISNDGSYQDLYNKVWDIVHENDVFHNITQTPICRSIDSNTYLRLYTKDDESDIWRLCLENGINSIEHGEDGDITRIDPKGGPFIQLYSKIQGTTIDVTSIDYDIETNVVWITALPSDVA